MIIDFHTHKSETAEGVYAVRSFCITEISEKQTINVPHSVGLHPWNSPTKNWFELLYKQAHNPQCLMIGECGLDKLHGINFTIQIENFKKQISLSENICKPLIIHCVKSYNELIEIRKSTHSKQPWIVHGFKGNIQLAKQLQTHGIYISIGTYIIKENATKLIETIKNIEIGKFFLETDISPLPISKLYQSVAEIIGCPITELTTQINNFFVSLQKINITE